MADGDGVTDIVDLGGNGKGVALNVWPHEERIPSGGAQGFVLKKETAADYDMIWAEDLGTTFASLTGQPTDNANLSVALDLRAQTTGDTFTGPVSVPDEAYGAGWNGNVEVPTKNALYDKIETIVASVPNISDAVYDATWNGNTTDAPSKNAVYDKIEAVVASIPAAVTEASNAEAWDDAEAGKFISPRRLYEMSAEVALTDGATITPDFNTGINFGVTLGGNRTLANPTNAKSGQSGLIAVTQDATGSRTLAYGTNWLFPGGDPTLSTTANAIDVISYFVRPDGTIIASIAKALS